MVTFIVTTPSSFRSAQLKLAGSLFASTGGSLLAGAEDVKAGRTVSLEEFDTHMRQKYGIPR
jgi:hypothetical protein